MNRKISWISVPLCTLFCLQVLIGFAEACVGCRVPGDTLGDPTKNVQAGIAFSWSVLFLLTVIFFTVSGLAMYIVRACRRADEAAVRIPDRRK